MRAGSARNEVAFSPLLRRAPSPAKPLLIGAREIGVEVNVHPFYKAGFVKYENAAKSTAWGMAAVPLDPVDADTLRAPFNGHHIPELNEEQVGNVMPDLSHAGRTRHFAKLTLTMANPELRNEELEVRGEQVSRKPPRV